LLPSDLILLGYNTANSISAGAAPQTPLGDLTAVPQTRSLILGGFFLGFLGQTAKLNYTVDMDIKRARGKCIANALVSQLC